MCAKRIEEIVTFKGEYPAYLLQPFRELVSVLVPYDECARNLDVSDTLALFDLLDLSGVFSEEFVNGLFKLSVSLSDYILASALRLPNEKRRVAYTERLNRSMVRIGTELHEEGTQWSTTSSGK